MPGFQTKTLVVTPISGDNFLPNLRILLRKNNERTLFILFRAMTDNEYIGQTKRQFGTRLKEHQKAVLILLQ